MPAFLLAAALSVFDIMTASQGAGKLYNLPSATAVLGTFDRAHPGRGPDFTHSEPLDHAMAYALFASSAAMLCRPDEAIRAADWLLANPARPGSAGWGQPFAWDAFRDGSLNSTTTIYGITTALAVRALLDVYHLTENRDYAAVALRALDYYHDRMTNEGEGAFFWYSDRPEDAQSIYNVSSMLMGQYARAAHLFARTDFRITAERIRRNLLANRRRTAKGYYWNYGRNHNRPNDAVHAAYTVQGLADFNRYLGGGSDIALEVSYLKSFIGVDFVPEFTTASHVPKSAVGQPARVWGLGMLIYTLAEVGEVAIASRAAGLLRPYQFAPARFGNRPGAETFLPRAQAHVVFGLARLKKAANGCRDR